MNGDNFTPSNQGTGKLYKGKIVFRFFLKTNQQFTETVKPGMANFNNPTASLEIRIAFNFHLFLTTRTDMRNVTTL